MRIAFLSAEYPPDPGGVGDYTRRLGLELAGRGHAMMVFTIVDQQMTIRDLSAPDAAQATTVGGRTGWDWRAWRAVEAALAMARPEVLHIEYQTGAYGMHPAINLLPWRLKRRPGVPAIAVTAHDLLPPYLFPRAGPMRDWVTQRLLSDADAAVVTNEADYARLAAAPAMRARLRLIPIGSNIAVAPPQDYDRLAWRRRLGVGTQERLVAYFGLMSRSKGLDDLLAALERMPDTRLLVIGGTATAPQDQAYAEAIKQQIAHGGLSERVMITGHLPDADVSACLLAADVAALPFTDGASFRRGSLLAVLAHGIPLVTTIPEGVAQRDTLVHEQNALLVPPNDPQALAAAIERVLHEEALRLRLTTGGRELASRFSWETIATRHEALYRALIAPERNVVD